MHVYPKALVLGFKNAQEKLVAATKCTLQDPQAIHVYMFIYIYICITYIDIYTYTEVIAC